MCTSSFSLRYRPLMSSHLLFVFFLLLCATETRASQGDRSFVYGRCMSACVKGNCLIRADLSLFHEYQPVYERLLLWSCQDDCSYQCMWVAIDAFARDRIPVPQFYGKVSFLISFILSLFFGCYIWFLLYLVNDYQRGNHFAVYLTQ